MTKHPAFVLLLLLSMPLCECGAAAPATRPHVDYMIVVTGSEILAGSYADAHTLFLTRTLSPLGLHCIGSMTVDDDPAAIQDALRHASGKASLIITTGGLGPTDNDLTRQTLSQFTGIPLHEAAPLIQDMEKRLKVHPENIRPTLRRQALVPSRGTYLTNPDGTAAGLVFEMENSTIVALPGPPRELQPMVRDKLVPYLTRRFGTRPPGCSLTLRFIGMGQSQISQTFKEKAPIPPDVIQFSAFDGSRVDFTFSLLDDTPQDRARLQNLKQKILACLGDNVYAEDETTLEECVARMLAAKKLKLALAESGSSGSLAAALGGTSVASDTLSGSFSAPTENQLRQLLHITDDAWVATPAVQQLPFIAATAATHTSAQWAIAVGQVQQDPAGAAFVQVAFRLPDGKIETHRMPLRGTGELARANLITQILDQLRRKLGK